VSPVRALYRRWRTTIGEAWRFGVVGAANVVINFVVFNAMALTIFPNGELKANIVATVFATTTSYFMNRGWTFRHRRTTRISREYVLFFVFNAMALAIELGVMGAAKYGLGLTTLLTLNLAKAAGLGLGTVFRFWTYRTFVFHGRPSLEPEPVAAEQPAAAGQPAAAQPASLVPRVEPGPVEAFAAARR
jgi:putative flippase GtrA